MYRATGLEHNEVGNPCADEQPSQDDGASRSTNADDCVGARTVGTAGDTRRRPVPLALVGWGRAASAAREARYALRSDGIELATFFPHLLWPLPEAGFEQLFAAGVRTLFVCETNSSGQFAELVRSQLSAQLVARGVEVVGITKDDGTPLTQHEFGTVFSKISEQRQALGAFP